MRCVLVESPYQGDVDENLRYLRACLHDCFMRGEAPFASHGLYTQKGVLDDTKPEERQRGIAAGLAWGSSPDTASTALVSWCGNHTSAFDTRPRVGKSVAAATPPAFRDVLLQMARSVPQRRCA